MEFELHAFYSASVPIAIANKISSLLLLDTINRESRSMKKRERRNGACGLGCFADPNGAVASSARSGS